MADRDERDPELTALIERMDEVVANANQSSRVELALAIRDVWERLRQKLQPRDL